MYHSGKQGPTLHLSRRVELDLVARFAGELALGTWERERHWNDRLSQILLKPRSKALNWPTTTSTPFDEPVGIHEKASHTDSKLQDLYLTRQQDI